MGQQVLLYTGSLPTRLSVEQALAGTAVEIGHSASPTDLLEKLQGRSWDAVILDAESSPVPLPKLLAAVSPRASSSGAAVLALTSTSDQARTAAPTGEAFLYDRPIRRACLLGALNRLLLARGKKPIVPASEILDRKRRRTPRIPLLVPVAYRFPAAQQATWTTGEAWDVSASGARVMAAAAVAPGQTVSVKNLLTAEEAAFRVVWVGDDLDEIAVGFRADREDLRFWRVA